MTVRWGISLFFAGVLLACLLVFSAGDKETMREVLTGLSVAGIIFTGLSSLPWEEMD